jgi:hypothetical protein
VRFVSLKPLENRTMPVGFYNVARHSLAHQFQTYKAEQALSAFGCYDRSGNVSEWTLEKLTKGGSYESPPEELTIHRENTVVLKKGMPLQGFGSLSPEGRRGSRGFEAFLKGAGLSADLPPADFSVSAKELPTKSDCHF